MLYEEQTEGGDELTVMRLKEYKRWLPDLDNRLSTIHHHVWSVTHRQAYADPIYGFDKYCSSRSRKRALVSYLPGELRRAGETSQPRLFNPTGAVVEITRALNELGYLVDMVDYRDRGFTPAEKYDLFVGHGSYNFERISSCINSNAVKVCYSTGCYWKEFRRQSQERYGQLAARRGTRMSSFVRHIEDEEYPSTQADLVICLGKMTAESYAGVSKRVLPINNASYIDSQYEIQSKGFEAARNRFLYWGGKGNIQKGLDLLIEAFIRTPHLHLYILSPLERELIESYSGELSQENIHYVYHHRFSPKRMSQLWRLANYTLYAGFNSGQSTALVGSLSYGLIPVVNRESDIEVDGNGFRIPSNSIEDIIQSITLVSQMPEDWYGKAARTTIAYFNAQHTAETFQRSFKEAIACVV